MKVEHIFHPLNAEIITYVTASLECLNSLLQDEEGKILGRATQVKTALLEEGSRLKVGGKEVEVCRFDVKFCFIHPSVTFERLVFCQFYS